MTSAEHHHYKRLEDFLARDAQESAALAARNLAVIAGDTQNQPASERLLEMSRRLKDLAKEIELEFWP